MYRILGNLTFLECYIDDIIIFSKTYEEYMEHLRIVLRSLNDNDLKLNLSKCVWFTDKIKVLGHVISREGVSMDPDKVKDIQNRSEPKNRKELQ